MAGRPRKTTSRKRRSTKKQSSIWENRQWHRFLGFFCILVGLLLVIAFTSYLFTWEQDQDFFKPFKFSFIFSDNQVENKLGRIGSMLSHLSFYNMGMASFIFPFIMFALGIRLLLPKKIFSFTKIAKYCSLAILISSITLGFFFGYNHFPYGGIFGNKVSNWLESFLGYMGTGLLLIFGTLLFLIFLFNYNLDAFFESLFRVKKIKKPSTDLSFLKRLKMSLPSFEASKAKKKAKTAKSIVPISVPKSRIDDGRYQDFDSTAADGKIIRSSLADSSEDVIDFDLKNSKSKTGGTLNFNKSKKTPISKEDLILDVDMPDDSAAGIMEKIKAEEEKKALGDNKKVEPTVIEKGDYDPNADLSNYKVPPLDLLEFYGNDQIEIDRSELEKNKERIVSTLANYNIEIEKIRATPGATITLYEIVPAPGIRISKIKGLVDDIALSLAALGIRIIAPIPGRGTIGIEIPNAKKRIVPLRELLASDQFQNSEMEMPIAIGTGIRNKVFVADLVKMPHLLMAGATGQGKSVCINAILASLIYKKLPGELKLILIDPKKVELSIYEKIQNHFLATLPDQEDAIVTDTKKVIHTLNALCIEMDNRYNLLKSAHVRNLREYNRKFIKRKLNPLKGHRYLPYFVLVIDEFADLIMTAGKEIEVPLTRLAQLARAVGIHLIVATQRPTVNIITGTIKANFPVRIAFRVTSKVDSRTIIDIGGAEQLIGQGDLILVQGADSYRLQGAFIDTPDIERVTDFIGAQQGYAGPFELPEYIDEKEAKKSGGMDFKMDKLFCDAARLIVGAQSGSTSLIQRKLSLGYNRAGRIMDQLERLGIAGPAQGSKPREVFVHDLITLEELITTNGWDGRAGND